MKIRPMIKPGFTFCAPVAVFDVGTVCTEAGESISRPCIRLKPVITQSHPPYSSEPDPQASDTSECVNPDRSACAPVRDWSLHRTVSLIGLMGAGKSSVGRRLASVLDAPFHDSDDEIVAAAGMSIPDIFATHGEPEFRRGEQRVIERLLEGPPCILATGGGAFVQPGTRSAMLNASCVVWLNAEFDVLWRRVSRRGGRPLLQTENPKQTLRDLMAARSPIYRQAHICVATRDGPHEETVAAVLDALKQAPQEIRPVRPLS
jgi:shikimate kinase